MRTVKKYLLTLTALLSAAALTACSKGEGEEEPKWTYVPEFTDLSGESMDLYDAQIKNGKIYYLSYEWDEENGRSVEVCLYSLKEGTTESHPFVWPEGLEDYNFNRYDIADDGSMYVIAYEYDREADVETNYLLKFDSEGKGVFAQDISEAVGDTYIETLVTDSGGRVYVVCDDEVLLYDAEGKAAGSVAPETGMSGWIRNVFCGGDGKVYMNYTTYDGSASSSLVAEIDFDSKKMGDAYGNFPSGDHVTAGGEWDFLVDDSISVYGYNMKGEQREKLFDWLNSDINGSSVSCIATQEDGKVVVLIEDWESNDTSVALLTRTETAQVAKRENIVIGTMGRGYGIQSYAAAFNRSNDKYRISVKTYIDYDNYDENSWSEALTRLNNDLTSANCPDIIDLSGLNITQLAAAGVFEDLGGFLDESSVISRSDFLESILNAYTLNGVLVSIPTSFELSTIVGSAADLGTEAGWTLEELMEYASAHPDAELFDGMSKNYMMQILMTYNEDSFIDWSRGECHFDSDMFKSLLEFVNRFPEEADYNGDPTPLRIQNKEVLLDTVNIYQFSSVQESIEIYEGKPVWIGFPTVDGKSSHALGTSQAYAITKKSDCKEGAWEFLESLLDGKNSRYDDGFPTRKDRLEAMIEEETRQFYTDENGELILDDDGKPIPIESMGGYSTWSEDGVAWNFEYHVVTQEEVDMVMSMIENAKMISNGGGTNEVMNIISEEAEAFFKGQKSVDEVAASIQSRASMYVSTNS